MFSDYNHLAKQSNTWVLWWVSVFIIFKCTFSKNFKRECYLIKSESYWTLNICTNYYLQKCNLRWFAQSMCCVCVGCVNFYKTKLYLWFQKRTSVNFIEFVIRKKMQPSFLNFEVGDLHKFGPEGGTCRKLKCA